MIEYLLRRNSAKYQGTTDTAALHIERCIFESGLRPGDKLPSHGELQELLGASQGAIREAIRILREKGLVEVKRGRAGGVYVSAVTSSHMGNSLALMIRQKQISPEHLLIFRNTLEVSAAALAVMEANAQNIIRLEKLAAQAEIYIKIGISAWSDFYQVEDLMHHCLIKMTKNPLLNRSY